MSQIQLKFMVLNYNPNLFRILLVYLGSAFQIALLINEQISLVLHCHCCFYYSFYFFGTIKEAERVGNGFQTIQMFFFIKMVCVFFLIVVLFSAHTDMPFSHLKTVLWSF